MAKKLKKCPFCRNKEGIRYMSSLEAVQMSVNDDDYEDELAKGWFIICNANKNGCGAVSGWGISKTEARKKWNKRT